VDEGQAVFEGPFDVASPRARTLAAVYHVAIEQALEKGSKSVIVVGSTFDVIWKQFADTWRLNGYYL
jgi:hypothetical protein